MGESNIILTRQRENILTALESWDRVKELAEVAGNATGTAMQKYEAYTKSIEYAQQSLKAAFEEFSQKLIDSGMVQNFYKLGEKGVEFLSLLMKIRPVLQGILQIVLVYKSANMLGTAIRNFEKLKSLNIVKTFQNMLNIRRLNAEAARLQEQADIAATFAEGGLITAEEAHEVQTRATTAATEAATAATSIYAAVLTAVVAAIGLGVSAYRSWEQHQDKIISDANEATRSFGELGSAIKNALSSLEKDSSSENVLSVQNSINEKIKEINKTTDAQLQAVNLVNKSYEEQKKLLEDVNSQASELSLTEAMKATAAAKAKTTNFFNRIFKNLTFGEAVEEDIRNELLNIDGLSSISGFDKVNDFETLLGFKGLQSSDASKQIKAYKQLKEAQDALVEKYSETTLYKKITNALADVEEAVGGYIQALDSQAQIEFNTYLKQMPAEAKESEKAMDKFIDTQVEGKGYSEEYIQALKEQGHELVNFTVETKTAEEVEESYVDTVTNLKKSLDDLSKAYKAIQSAITEYNENGYISLDTLESLLNDYPDYIKFLVDENGNIKDNSSTLRDYIGIKAQEMAVSSATNYLKKFQNATEAEATALLNANTGATLENVNAQWQLLYAQIAQLNYSAQVKQAIWNNMKAMAELANRTAITAGSTSKASSSEDKYAKAIKYAQKLIETKINALQEEKEAIEAKNKAMQDELDLYDKSIAYVNKVVDTRIKALEDEKKALEDKNDESERELKLQELKNNLAKAQERTIRVYHGDTDTWVWETDKSALAKAQQDLADFEKEDAAKAIDKQIEAINKYKEALADLPNVYKEEAEELAFLQNQSFITTQGIDDLNIKEITNFAREYANKQRAIAKNTTDSIDEQIDHWNKLKDKWGNIKDEYETAENAKYMIALMGATSEAEILSGREDFMDNFTQKYIGYLKSQASNAESAAGRINAANMSIDLSNFEAFEDNISRFENNISRLEDGFDKIDTTTAVYRELYARSLKLLDKTPHGGAGFADGTKSAPEGLANVNERGEELLIPAKGNLTFLQKGTGVLPHSLTERVFALANNPIGYLQTAAMAGVGGGQQIVNIQNLNLPNVKDSDSFIKEMQIITHNR